MKHCIDCNKTVSFYAIRCKSCARKGTLNPIFGLKRPEISLSQLGQNNPNFKHGLTSINKKYYCIKCNKEINYHTAIYDKSRCQECYLNTIKGRNHPRFGKIATHSKPIYYKDICFRSSWEVKFAQWCDKNNIIWLYESKTFDLGNTTYTPDFYLPEFHLYIEIKGFWRDDAKEKFEEFQKQYQNEKIKVIEEKQLKEYNIL